MWWCAIVHGQAGQVRIFSESREEAEQLALKAFVDKYGRHIADPKHDRFRQNRHVSLHMHEAKQVGPVYVPELGRVIHDALTDGRPDGRTVNYAVYLDGDTVRLEKMKAYGE